MLVFEEVYVVGKFSRIFMITTILCFFLFLYVDEDFMLGLILSIIFTLSFEQLKFKVSVYDDSIVYRLYPFDAYDNVLMFDSIISVKEMNPLKLGIVGFKFKKTPTGIYYYAGGKKIIRFKLNNSRDIYLSIKNIEKLRDVLKSKRCYEEGK